MKPFPVKLNKPIAFFDIESTGLDRRQDRIIDIAFVIYRESEQPPESCSFRLNPQMSIPPESTAIHGIGDDDVKNCPTFESKAAEMEALLAGCDLAGYNIAKFDVPMLAEEFKRAGRPFSLENRKLLDVQRIFHLREPRNLAAALKFYCGKEHSNAHGAMPDVEATIDVFDGQLAMYKDLPQSIEELHDMCFPINPEWVDKEGRLKWVHHEAVINFGQNKGKTLREMKRTNPGFLDWMLRADFPADTMDIIQKAKSGVFPSKSS